MILFKKVGKSGKEYFFNNKWRNKPIWGWHNEVYDKKNNCKKEVIKINYQLEEDDPISGNKKQETLLLLFKNISADGRVFYSTVHNGISMFGNIEQDKNGNDLMRIVYFEEDDENPFA